jgi:hypothetical protein
MKFKEELKNKYIFFNFDGGLIELQYNVAHFQHINQITCFEKVQNKCSNKHTGF